MDAGVDKALVEQGARELVNQMVEGVLEREPGGEEEKQQQENDQVDEPVVIDQANVEQAAKDKKAEEKE